MLLQPCRWPGIGPLLEQTVLVPQISLASLPLQGEAEPSPLCLPSWLPGCPSFPLAQDGPASIWGVFKSIFFKDKCCWYSQKDSPASARPQVPSLTLCSGSALVRCFPPHPLWLSHWGVLLAGQMLRSSPLCPGPVTGPSVHLPVGSPSDPLNSTWKLLKNHNPDFQCVNSTFSWLFLLNFYCWRLMV